MGEWYLEIWPSPVRPENIRDPIPGDEDNETPRKGVGNQPEGHPFDHADTVGPVFSDAQCAQG